MRATSLIILLSSLQLAMAAPSVAGSFQATPVNVEMRAPASTSSVTLKNDADAPMNVQVRVFRWSQTDGKEQLVPSTDLVASPPMATIAPRSEQSLFYHSHIFHKINVGFGRCTHAHFFYRPCGVVNKNFTVKSQVFRSARLEFYFVTPLTINN